MACDHTYGWIMKRNKKGLYRKCRKCPYKILMAPSPGGHSHLEDYPDAPSIKPKGMHKKTFERL
jgi:DNA-directed RNA polymerase subunit RPC12/RpoP